MALKSKEPLSVADMCAMSLYATAPSPACSFILFHTMMTAFLLQSSLILKIFALNGCIWPDKNRSTAQWNPLPPLKLMVLLHLGIKSKMYFCQTVYCRRMRSFCFRDMMHWQFPICTRKRLKLHPDTPQHYDYITIENITGSIESFLNIKPWTQFWHKLWTKPV